MAKPSDHPDFKRLMSEWDRRLADSGFRDIEEIKNGQRVLKKSGTQVRFEQSNELVRHAQAQYFAIISKRIHETVFEDDCEREILVLYVEGITQAEIRKRLTTRLSRSTIYKKLYKWLKTWGLK